VNYPLLRLEKSNPTYWLSLLFLPLWMICSPSVKGQSFQPISYDTSDGLNSNTIYRVVQDNDGFIWIGTQNGLCRFDGNRFLNYPHPELKDQDIILLRSSPDTALVGFVNLSRQIGMATRDSIYLMHDEKGDPIYGMDFCFGKTGTIWVWSKFCIPEHYCLKQYDLSGKLLRSIQGREISGLAEISFNRETGDFYTIGYQLANFDPEGRIKRIHQLADLPIFKGYRKMIGIRLNRLSSGEYLFIIKTPEKGGFGQRGRLGFLGNDSLQSIRIADSPADFNIFTTFQDSSGQLWLGSNYGLHELRMLPGGIGKITQTYLEGQTIHTLFSDREGNIWIGSKNHGLYMLPQRRYAIFSPGLLGYQGEGPRKIAADSQKITGICADGSLIMIDEEGNHKRREFPELKNFSHCYPGRPGKLVLASDYSTFELDEKNFDLDRISEYKFSPYPEPASCSKDILAEGNKLWIGNCSRLYLVDVEKRKIDFDYKGRTVSLLKDEESGNLWFGAQQGIFVYEPDKRPRLYVDKEGQSLRAMAYALVKGEDGNIYIGTHGQGLWCISKGRLRPLNEELGLNAYSFIDLHADGKLLWTSSERGLIKIDLQRMEAIPVGIPGVPTACYYFARTKNYLWVSTSSGILRIPRKQKKPRPEARDIFLESFVAKDKQGQVMEGRTFSHHFNQVDIDISAPVYSQNVQFQYRLTEDGTWQDLEQSSLSLKALRPGKYKVEISARGEEHSESFQPLSLGFEISPPFWRRTDFLLVFFLMLGLILFGLIRNFYAHRLQRYKEREAMLREIEVLRVQALQAQMNPHFTFNALHAIQEQLLRKNAISAIDYLADFASLIRKSLDMINAPFIALQEEVDFLKTYIRLELIRQNDEVSVRWDIDPSLNLHKLYLPPMLIQPLIENAFKHGISQLNGGGILKIMIGQKNDFLIISVEDNGRGIKALNSKNHQEPDHISRGLSLIQNRLSLINTQEEGQGLLELKDLNEESFGQRGTRATIRLPISICKNPLMY